HRSQWPARHLPGEPGRKRTAKDDRPAGWFGPQLVGNDGLMRKPVLLLAALIAVPASAQLPGLRRRAPPPQVPVQNPVDVLRADFAAQSGGTTVYFANGSAELTPQAKLLLQAQAAWLRQHPDVAVRIEGHGDSADTRDHALALGAERRHDDRSALRRPGAGTRRRLTRRAPGAAPRRSREPSSPPRSRRGIPAPGCFR